MTQPTAEQIASLKQGAVRLTTLPIAQRRKLLQSCIEGVSHAYTEWLETAWQAKRIRPHDPARAEEILTGIIPTLRYLQLLDQTLHDIDQFGQPRLPGKALIRGDSLHIPVFPTHDLFDRLLFGPLTATVHLPRGITHETMFGTGVARASGRANDHPEVTLVLGAGNVSSIPITDALTKIFQLNQCVLLKMNPVNAYLQPVFEQAFSSLVDANLLRIVSGGAELGAELISSSNIDRVHITGSNQTHDAIVWGTASEEREERKSKGNPLLRKPITSELGNVSPWIIVPGNYSPRQLRFQAENIAASIVNNASFNCIATKMLITCRNWPQRDTFLDLLDKILASIPRRFAYYPGAAARYQRFADRAPTDPERLPWTLRRNVDVADEPRLFEEESFVCVCGETALDSETPCAFLHTATEFANYSMWGTLAAALTVPKTFFRQHKTDLDQAIERLRFGTVGMNQWPGVVFALMSTPWGAFPGSTLEDIQSGLGNVHNTFLLDSPEKTVIASPLTVFPKPVWFSTHRCPEAVARRLLKLYMRPTWSRLPPVLTKALSG